MRLITISREFGSGGRELGKRLADLLHFDYYDSEIIASVAGSSGLDAGFVEKRLSDHGWQSFPITYRGTLSSVNYAQASTISLLLQQKTVIEEIGALGKDCVIVGRNADVILADYHPLNIFVCAETEAKVQRCLQRQSAQEELSAGSLIRKMRQIDKMRARTRAIISGSEWGRKEAYHLTVNTTGQSIKALAPAVAAFAECWFRRT